MARTFGGEFAGAVRAVLDFPLTRAPATAKDAFAELCGGEGGCCRHLVIHLDMLPWRFFRFREFRQLLVDDRSPCIEYRPSCFVNVGV